MSYAIKATKAGYNVLTESDPNNYIFNSDHNTFKIVGRGSGSWSIPADSAPSKTITHNYGTRTGFIVFFKHPNGRITWMSSPVHDASSVSDITIRSLPRIANSANTITMTIHNWDEDDALTVNYSYYLFEIPV